MNITFHDVSDARGDWMSFKDIPGVEPMVIARVMRGADRVPEGALNDVGDSVRLNYSQVFKLRDQLNVWLATKLGSGQPLWTEHEK